VGQTITPYLCVHDARTALEWYRSHFGASVSNVTDWDGKVGHAELEVGGAVFYLSDEAPKLGVVAPASPGSSSSVSFVLMVADVANFIDRAVAGGAVLQRPIEASHGTRNGWLMDPFGHRWNVGTPLPDRGASAGRRAPAEPYYFTLSCPDVERAAAFYGSVLDWQFAEPNEQGGRHVANTRQPVGLRPMTDRFGDRAAGEITMWFIARDFDDALDRVRSAGGTVQSITSYDSGREAVCVDDQGTTFRLSEPAPGYDPDH
jgi:uncharacterized glyoxalase superfamily protein PhnB/catechol 2,3-dioxygenase-like lactoylglutathione lyase family enzyme